MKINCQSCEAKYTIADEKVRGKTVKIRCKKCGAVIVVRGGEAPPNQGVEEEEDDATRVYPHAGGQPASAATSMEWTLNMPDGDQRAVSVEEIGQLLASGAINGETYAWRDGMADWQPLNQITELAPVLASPVPRPSAAPAPDPRLAGKLLGGGEAGPARVAARRAERAKDQDLFGSARTAGSDEEIAARSASSPSTAPAPKHTFTAERGENSVLFSVEAIRAAGKPQTKRPPADDDKVDFSAIASNIPPPMDAPAGGYDEVLNSPPSFPSFGGPVLAAPMLPTSIEPEPPPPPDPAVAAADDVAMAPAKSNKGLVIGLAAAVGVLAVIALAFGGYVLFSRTPPADTTSSALSATTASAAPAAAPDTAAGSTPDAAAQEPSAAATTETGDAGPARPAAPSTAAKGDSARDPKPESTKKDEHKKDDKKDESKDAPAPAADTAAAGGAPFSRSAAVAALNAAAGAASGCKKPDGPTGRGRVSVTFAPSGKVSSAVVEGPPFAGTSVGGCVAAAFRRATVPPFTGSPVTVHKSFTIQ